ncbi:MAG: VCBS repeat-containing protein [Candidatus Cloacimonetes bacterium]|nr:VCBS repeat-containing protein [Candidatus Cloacimonadota bacterium]
MYKYFTAFLGVLLVAFSFAHAANVNLDFTFDRPALVDNHIITDFTTAEQIPGEPLMPFYGAKILLPYGEKIISIKTTHSDWELVANDTYIDFARTPQPTSVKEIIPTQRNEKVYSSDSPYPAMEYKHVSTEMYTGHSIALINIYPIRYIPSSGIVEYASDWSLEIETTYHPDHAVYQSKMLKNSDKTLSELDMMVDNPYETQSYLGKETPSYYRDDLIDPSEPHDYIIITSENFLPTFTSFKNWKINRGMLAEIYTVEDIFDNYAGSTNAEKIRNFLILAYASWLSTSNPLEYVLLGGDDEIVPDVQFYVAAGSTIGYIPSDLYYGGLDGSWNADGDNRYGEMNDNPDFYPELAVGRIPGDTQQDFVNAIYKIQSYTDVPKPALEKACMVGENLNWNPVTWGGDYKDDVATRIPTDNYHFYTLYQREETYSGTAVKNAINSGMGIINHMGHANYSILMGMSPNTPDTFTNDEYGFIYTQGCYPAAFDDGTSSSSECVGERLVIAEHGPMAFVGNTRYGWYSPGSIEGTSQQFDRTFFDALFIEDIRELGKANDYSKVALVSTVDNPWMRWCYYELILFGDPGTEVIMTDGEYPNVEVTNVDFNDTSGDNDGIINPGEQIEMVVEIQNLPDWQLAENIIVEFICDSSFISIQNNTYNFGNLSPGNTINNSANPFIFSVSPSCGYEHIEYQLHVTANQSATYSFDKTYHSTFSVSLLQNNWPTYLGAEVKSSPIVIDLDNDEVDEIVAVDRLGNIFAITTDAQTKPGFPIELDEEIWASLAAGDLDNDGDLEMVVAGRNGMVYAYHHDGTQAFSYEIDGQIITTPTLADLNGDDYLETIIPCIDSKLYVIDHEGNDYGSFPYEFSAALCSDVAVGDINNDGVIDMLVGGVDGKVHAIDNNMNILAGFPVQTESHIWASPIIFDNDLIAFGNSSNKLYIIDGTGSVVHSEDLPASLFSSPIAFSKYPGGAFNLGYSSMDGGIGILDASGTMIDGWPLSMNSNSKTSPVASDINGDGNVELLASTQDGQIFCYSYDGTMLPEFPIFNPTSVTSPISLHDLDGDGDYEILAGTTSGISVWDYKGEYGPFHPWMMYRGNIQRTGNYAHNQTYAVEPEIPANNFSLKQNFPNPFNNSTTISYSPGTYHFEQAQVAIFNIKGQMIRQLPFDTGSYSVHWDGTDSSGKTRANGVYLYKLLTENYESDVKRLLLIK